MTTRSTFCVLLTVSLFLSNTVFGKDLGPSDLVVAEDPELLYVLERDARQIRRIRLEPSDTDSGGPRLLPLSFAPSRMRLFPDRRHLAVVGGGPCGRLAVVDLATFETILECDAGHSPSDVTVHVPDGPDTPARVYVANRFGGDIFVFELSPDRRKAKELKRLSAGREPIALVVSPDGSTLIVAAHLPEDPALQYDIASRIRFIETGSGRSHFLRLTPGTMNLRDIVLEPSGRYAFVTGIQGHFEHIPDSVSGGWMNENFLYVIDVEKRNMINTFFLDEHGVGSANPWGVSVSDDGRFLLVAAAGSCDIVLIDLPSYRANLDFLSGRSPDLTEPVEPLPAKMRVPVGLKGVRHVLMTKGRILASSYFEDSLVRIDPEIERPTGYLAGLQPQDNLEIPRKKLHYLRPDDTNPIRANYVSKPGDLVPDLRSAPEGVENAPLVFVPLSTFSIAPGIRFRRSFARLGPEPDWTETRYGEMLFHDAVLCLEHWQSCISCHPGARSDTLNWDLLNDGWDNPKNSKSLLLSHDTPPSMVTGIRKDAETAVRKGFESILFTLPTPREAEAVDTYLQGLEPVASPNLIFDRSKPDGPGRLSEAARRGKRIFNSDRSGCSSCHPEPLFTDMRRHDVGTQNPNDHTPLFDTPTLVEVWRTAPYLHDGRYQTIRQVIVEGKHVNLDGRLDRLTDAEIDDLVEYVLSL